MNFGFYIFGTPNGYDQYPADNKSDTFYELIKNNSYESQLTVQRSRQIVYYIYIRRIQEKPNNFFGLCLIFNGVYCHNIKKLFELFGRAYFDIQSEGYFFKFDKGKTNYSVNKFTDRSHEIERIKSFFKSNLENNLIQDFDDIPSRFKFGNGERKISINKNNNDILSNIAEYETVHIWSKEKILSGVHTGKHNLQQRFSNLSIKKKLSIFVVLVLVLLYISWNIYERRQMTLTIDPLVTNGLIALKEKVNCINKILENKPEDIEIKESTDFKLTGIKLRLSSMGLSTPIKDITDLESDVSDLEKFLQGKGLNLDNCIEK
ncbi:MAG: hypothetical protein AAFZ15_29465 [Bacteroidota bacterium]